MGRMLASLGLGLSCRTPAKADAAGFTHGFPVSAHVSSGKNKAGSLGLLSAPPRMLLFFLQTSAICYLLLKVRQSQCKEP